MFVVVVNLKNITISSEINDADIFEKYNKTWKKNWGIDGNKFWKKKKNFVLMPHMQQK